MPGLALGALLILFYTYAGYPLLVAFWARLFPKKVEFRDDYEPVVSVCLAVHDGALYLERKLESLLSLDYPPEKFELLACSDGSRDATEELLRTRAKGDPRIRVFVTEGRSGKPSALNLMGSQARGDVLVMTDVRQTLAPNALRALVRFLADPSVGCVSGTLVLKGESGAGAYWRYERFIRGAEARLGGMVGVSGSLYAMRRSDWHALPSDVLLDDMFVPLRVAHAKKRIVLSDEAKAYDDAADDEREFARKVRTLAGNYQLVAKLPWLLVPGKNPVWFQMVSHKLLRLACPFALAALFGASVALSLDSKLPALELAFFRGLTAAQATFYALAALGSRAGRFGALARTFVVLNAAAVVGLWRFARGTQEVTW
jgi:cellulose synthase/poly-beta-1,6-N-acetylglucosamine synthase-like glycosyltransferase